MFNLFKRNICTFEIGILHCPLKGQCRWLSCDVTEWFRNLMGLSSEDSSFFCSEISRILQMKPFFQWPSALRLAYFAVGTWFLQLVFHFLVFFWQPCTSCWQSDSEFQCTVSSDDRIYQPSHGHLDRIRCRGEFRPQGIRPVERFDLNWWRLFPAVYSL